MNREDRDGFERVMLPHIDAAYNLARWLTRDGHAAEDVVQEAYCRAAKFFPGFRGGDGRAWLLTVVRRAAFDWLQKNRVWAAAPFDETEHSLDDDSHAPDRLAARRDDGQFVRSAVEALPPEYREAIVLRELEGLDYQTIAAVTAVPVGTVMSRLSRARKQLRERLAVYPDGEG